MAQRVNNDTGSKISNAVIRGQKHLLSIRVQQQPELVLNAMPIHNFELQLILITTNHVVVNTKIHRKLCSPNVINALLWMYISYI